MAGSKGSKYYDVFLNYKIWFSYRDELVLDETLIAILQGIDKSGSLMTASKELKISYRKAWGDLKKAENTLGLTFTEKIRGGKSGGKSILTDEGRNIINAYNELKSDFGDSISRVTKKFFNTINK